MFLNPKMCIAQAGLREGMRVADFGAGNGEYALEASSRVGHTGKVYAIEVQRQMVKKLEAHIKDRKVANIECVWGDIENRGGSKLADHSMDVVIISNALFAVSDKIGLVDEAQRVLKAGGKVIVIDWTESYGHMGPTPRDVVNEKMAKDLFEMRNFKYAESISTGEHHYGIIFNRI